MNFKNKEEFQSYGLKLLRENNYNGTIVADTGSSKSKIAIDAIKQGGFKSILITSPRTNLKENWNKELMKWNILNIPKCKEYYIDPNNEKNGIFLKKENIQTCYKWDKDRINTFDVIIADECHKIFTPEYSSIIITARELNIPVIALTATPDKDDEFRKEFYPKHCPILIEYHNAEEDGLVNKTKFWVYEYELSNDYKVKIETKNKTWYQGELDRYNYIQKVFEESKFKVEQFYFSELWKRSLERVNDSDNNKYTYKLSFKDKEFIGEACSKNLQYFYELTKPRYEAKDMSPTLYYALKEIKGYNYSILGTNAVRYLSSDDVPKEVKPEIAKYHWAMIERKNFLWNLESSKDIALRLKNIILFKGMIKGKEIENTGFIPLYQTNKILLFSELTSQADKLSQYSIHSKNGETAKKIKENNKELLDKFNKGEIRELSSCLSLVLGLNLIGANWAIYESYSGSKTNAKQKVGRTHRLDVKDIANNIVIVPKNTQAEEWHKNAFGWIEDYTVINDINELKL